MAYLSNLGWLLHEEHFRILMLMYGIEQRVTGDQAATPLDPRKEEDRTQLGELADSLHAIVRHNAFEESVLLPLACNGGKSDVASLLREEHCMIGPLTRGLQHLVHDLTHNGAEANRWAEFCRTARDFVTCMMEHLQTEELSLVQRLPQFIDAETDRGLAHRYRAERSNHRFGPAFEAVAS